MSIDTRQNLIFANQRKAFTRIRDGEEHLNALSQFVNRSCEANIKAALQTRARLELIEFRVKLLMCVCIFSLSAVAAYNLPMPSTLSMFWS